MASPTGRGQPLVQHGLTEPRYGLIPTARDATGDVDRWERGVIWQPECPAALVRWVECVDDVASGGPTKTIEPRPDLRSADPIVLSAGDRCSTLGSTSAALTQDRVDRATRQLLNAQSRELESFFYSGDVDVAAPFLRDTNLVDLSPLGQSSPLVYGLAALEEAAGDALNGAQAMLHVTVPTAVLWYSARAIERRGNLLFTALDNIVVPGVGYSGAAPNGVIDPTGDTAYAYATGLVDVRLGPIAVYGDERTIDREANTWEVRAERPALATFDPCLQAGIRVNLCSTFCVPTGS